MSKARDLADLVSTGGLLADGAVSVSEISDITATAAELNTLDGITASTADLNNVAGINSDVQTQLDLKAPLASPTFTGDATFDTDTLAVDSTNNRVGIGTTSPSGSIDVAVGSGDIVSNFDGSPMITYRNGTGAWFHAGKHPSDDAFVFTTGATSTTTERMRIDSIGRVAIGDTPKASFTGHSILQVGGQAILGANDTLSTTSQTYLSHNLYFDTSGNYQVFNTGSANEGAVYTQFDGIHRWSNSAATTGTPTVQERLRIGQSVEIGIGGANYGTAGQVLTSGGSGAAPTWADAAAGGAAFSSF